ncbi:MAG TPA: hypothetical protein VES20_04935 [Bryobacteraceae bacterium]|nr:hypothetical protein [Bryobacteraceae bacterium]
MLSVRAAAALLLTCSAINAVEIHIRFEALERMLAQQLFTEEGRRYVRGNREAKCNYAWLERPSIRGENGRLRITAKFTGRTSLDLFGRCMGMGDSFDVRILALPFFRDGYIGLQEVEAVPEGRGGFYAGRVCAVLSTSLGREFRYPLSAEAKKGLEDPGAQPGYPRELRKFTAGRIRVTADSVVLPVDFELVVK